MWLLTVAIQIIPLSHIGLQILESRRSISSSKTSRLPHLIISLDHYSTHFSTSFMSPLFELESSLQIAEEIQKELWQTALTDVNEVNGYKVYEQSFWPEIVVKIEMPEYSRSRINPKLSHWLKGSHKSTTSFRVKSKSNYWFLHRWPARQSRWSQRKSQRSCGISWRTFCHGRTRRHIQEIPVSFKKSVKRLYTICGTGNWCMRGLKSAPLIILTLATLLTRSVENIKQCIYGTDHLDHTTLGRRSLCWRSRPHIDGKRAESTDAGLIHGRHYTKVRIIAQPYILDTMLFVIRQKWSQMLAEVDQRTVGVPAKDIDVSEWTRKSLQN